MKQIKLESFDGTKLHAYVFEVDSPKGVVQITHGMQEHAKRYTDFAQFLNSHGYTVFAHDLRGHGRTATDEVLGYSEGDTFEDNVKDMLFISKYLKEKYAVPLYVFGHSYGSFLTQNYLTRCGDLPEKAVLCGTAYTKTGLFRFAKLTASLTSTFKGKKKNAKLIENLSFKSYGKKFPNGNWLTRDEKKFQEYQDDPLCGTPFPANFYKTMFRGVLKNYKNVKKIEVPVLIISGTSDPVGGKESSLAKKLYEVYNKAGVDVDLITYPNARHELLNETNKEEVYNDILKFYEK